MTIEICITCVALQRKRCPILINNNTCHNNLIPFGMYFRIVFEKSLNIIGIAMVTAIRSIGLFVFRLVSGCFCTFGEHIANVPPVAEFSPISAETVISSKNDVRNCV